MKRLFILSGIMTLIMTVLVIAGVIKFDQRLAQAMNRGNTLYNVQEYESAIGAYEEALVQDEGNSLSHYNRGLVAYVIKDYEQAVEHLAKSKNQQMILGNTYYRLGNGSEDPQQQMQVYQQAMEQYKMGIIADPNNIEIKYNYEFIKKLLDEQQKENQENQDQQNEDQENQEDQNQQNEDSENEEKSEENKDQENQDGQNENQENQDGQQDQQNQEENSEQKDEQQSSEDEKQDEEEKQGKESQSGEEGELTDQEKAAIEQVLRMLEQQEKQSLKNNQAIMNQGKEEDNDW